MAKYLVVYVPTPVQEKSAHPRRMNQLNFISSFYPTLSKGKVFGLGASACLQGRGIYFEGRYGSGGKEK